MDGESATSRNGEGATVFALSSAPGRAGVAVVRLSGPGAGPALEGLAGPLPAARRASLRSLRDPASGETLDRALVLWFPAPASFSGEDMAELHLHGSRAVVSSVLEALESLPGLRPAEPGDFTRRAFDNGRLDLTEVEGLADLIAAETAAQRRQALALAGGALSGRAEAWRERLGVVLAHLEAAIDFSEEDLPADLTSSVARHLATVAREIGALLDDGGWGERVREGFRVAVVGAPNVGKSSLVNALARREVAIVTEEPGTTRDLIEVALDLGGLAVTLADTAGLRPLEDPGRQQVEAEGMRRARAWAGSADLVLELRDAARPDAVAAELADGASKCLEVWNKLDLARPPDGALAVSVRSGQGLDALAAEIGKRLAAEAPGDSLVARARHRAALAACRSAVARAAALAAEGRLEGEPELVAEEVRAALAALGRLVGTLDVEELLGRVFAEFCIGK